MTVGKYTIFNGAKYGRVEEFDTLSEAMLYAEQYAAEAGEDVAIIYVAGAARVQRTITVETANVSK